LRDSRHIGVAYGEYDLNRLLVTLTAAIDPETESPVLAVEEGGEHAAEALIVARYMMFTQVYFQRTRRAYDHHSAQAVEHLLEQERRKGRAKKAKGFPPPTSQKNVEEYLKWDDWRVLGKVHEGLAGENGTILLNRAHHRCVFETPEVPDATDLEFAEKVVEELDAFVGFTDKAESSWYKFEAADIPILLRPGQGDEELTALSRRSTVVGGLKAVNRTRIYVKAEDKEMARARVSELRK
jgi:HD superfamily phosphohydrolase